MNCPSSNKQCDKLQVSPKSINQINSPGLCIMDQANQKIPNQYRKSNELSRFINGPSQYTKYRNMNSQVHKNHGTVPINN